MNISSLKDLEKLIKLCRQTGIEAIEVDGIKINLGPTPTIIKRIRQKNKTESTIAPGGITEDVMVPATTLTEEQLLFYSAGNDNQQ